MKLDDTQIAKVREWIEQGLKVADVQNRLATELDVRLTYMEARLLLDDLRLRPKDAPAAPAPVASPLTAPSAPPAPASPGLAGPGGGPLKTVPVDESALGGSVSVKVDDITRPGALVSGKVTFRDGHTADWQLDQFGRLGVIPGKPGYKPAPGDVQEFQAQLETLLSRMGY